MRNDCTNSYYHSKGLHPLSHHPNVPKSLWHLVSLGITMMDNLHEIEAYKQGHDGETCLILNLNTVFL